MIEKVRFFDTHDYSDIAPSPTNDDLSPLSPFSPTPKAFKPTQETWKLWSHTNKDFRQAFERRLNFNRLHGSKSAAKTTTADKTIVLNITDGFQYRVDGLLEEEDYKQATNNLLNPKSLSPALSLKPQDQYVASLNSLVKLDNVPKENITIRRKSDVSSWSGGVSNLETKTVFLPYRPPRGNPNKSRNTLVDLAPKPQNSTRKRGATTLELPKKTPKLYTQKTFANFNKDKPVAQFEKFLGVPGRESASGSLVLDNMKTPKKDIKEESRRSGNDSVQQVKLERKKDPTKLLNEPSEDIDIPIDDGESEIGETGAKKIAASEANTKKKVVRRKTKKMENHNSMSSTFLQQLHVKPKVLQPFKSSSVSRRRPLAPITPALKCTTGILETPDKKVDYNPDYNSTEKPEILQHSRILTKPNSKSNPGILQIIQKKALKNLSNQLQTNSDYQSSPSMQSPIPTSLIKKYNNSAKNETNPHQNRMISEKRIRMSPSGHGFHFPSTSFSMSKFNDKDTRVPSFGASSGSEHRRLTGLRPVQKIESPGLIASEMFPRIKDRPQRQKDGNLSLSKIKVQEIMSAYGTFFTTK